MGLPGVIFFFRSDKNKDVKAKTVGKQQKKVKAKRQEKKWGKQGKRGKEKKQLPESEKNSGEKPHSTFGGCRRRTRCWLGRGAPPPAPLSPDQPPPLTGSWHRYCCFHISFPPPPQDPMKLYQATRNRKPHTCTYIHRNHTNEASYLLALYA